MANINNPHGLQPLGISLSGGPNAIEYFAKAATYGTAIFKNDPVNRVADGTIEASATPGTTLYSGVSMNYGAASTATDHAVIISPDAIFEAQSDGATGLVAADMGLNCNLKSGAGSTTTKISKWVIETATADVTATLDVHLHNKLAVIGNDYGQYSRIEVTFNKHRMAAGAVGV